MQIMFLVNPQHSIPRLFAQGAWHVDTTVVDLQRSQFILANWKGAVFCFLV